MLNGIDISSWQAGISVADVPSDFVIVKATEGTIYTSPNMHEQADATLSSGKLLGFYHFAQTGDACEEADFFCSAVADYLPSAALFLDYEADALGNGSGWAYNFLSHVKERTGQVPGVYMSKSVCRSQDWSIVAAEGYPLWVAQYANNERMGYTTDPWTDGYGYGAWDAPAIYQYSSSGDLDGYSGNLDINLFYGTNDDWQELFQRGDTMTFDDVWFGETLNDKRTPKDEAYTTPANLLSETAIETHENWLKLDVLETKVDKLLAALAK